MDISMSCDIYLPGLSVLETIQLSFERFDCHPMDSLHCSSLGNPVDTRYPFIHEVSECRGKWLDQVNRSCLHFL
jgi:hypothetical protein